MAARILFVFASFILAYTWAGYPCLLWILKKLGFARRVPESIAGFRPSVTVLLTVHNEEKTIAERLANLQDTQYAGELRFLVVSDASTDATDSLVETAAVADPRIRLRRADRLGKSGAQNLVLKEVDTDVVVLTDAESAFAPDFVAGIASHFADPHVGCATGNLLLRGASGSVAESQGMYWEFEQFLRSLESDLGFLCTASGQCMAFRRSAFQPFEPIYGDDCVIPLDLALAGFFTVFATNAVAYDSMPHTPSRELKTRIRMTNRNLLGTLSRPKLLNPFRHPGAALSLVSHKLLRWLTPLLALSWLASTVILSSSGLIYVACLCVQLAFIGWALAGWKSVSQGKECRFGTGQAYSFVLANVGFALGLISAIRGNRITVYRS